MSVNCRDSSDATKSDDKEDSRDNEAEKLKKVIFSFITALESCFVFYRGLRKFLQSFTCYDHKNRHAIL